MKAFLVGLIIGLIIAFPLGMNVGKGKPVFSNPFTDKPLAEQIKDAARETSEAVKEKTGEMVEETKDAINKATE